MPVVPQNWPRIKKKTINILREQHNELTRRKKEHLYMPNLSKVMQKNLNILLFGDNSMREKLLELLNIQEVKHEVNQLGKTA